jgi:hypothetical protein
LVTFFSRNYIHLRRSYVLSAVFRTLLFQLCWKTSVFLVSIGVILTTLSRPSGPSKNSSEDFEQYIIGICMLTISLLLTGVLGMLQELTYRKYGPCWREGVFYTVSLIGSAARFIIEHYHSISYPYQYSYSWFQTLSKVSGVCLHHLQYFMGHTLSWLETFSLSLYVFLESTGSHLYVFEILFWFWTYLCCSEWFSRCHRCQQTLYSPHAKLSACALVCGGLTMDGIDNWELVQQWFLWALCCSLYSNCKIEYIYKF